MSRSVGNTPDVTSLQGGTAGQVAYQSAPSTTAFAGPGTSGQVLTSNGASAPTFQTVSAGAVSPTYQIFSSGSGTYTPPATASYLIVEMVGGGGGGGRSTGGFAGWGGNGANYLKVKFPKGTYSYTVGAAGNGGASNGATGADGTASTFSTLSASGGAGGQQDPVSSNSSQPASTTTGATQVLLDIRGQVGASGVSSPIQTSQGGASFLSTGSTSSGYEVYLCYGYGGGGHGSRSGYTAREGTVGRIIITEYY